MADQEQGVAPTQGTYLSQRHRLATIKTRPKVKETGAGICAIVALAVYAVLVAAQWMDWSAYQFQ